MKPARKLLPLALLALSVQCTGGSSRQPSAESGGSAGASPAEAPAGTAGGGRDGAQPDGGASAIAVDPCSSVVPLAVPGGVLFHTLVIEGTTRGRPDGTRGKLAPCVELGLGADRLHQLDLSHLAERVRVRAILDADFDALLSLEQGPCEDRSPRLCDRARAARRSSSGFSVELDPGKYLLVVDGAGSDDEGDYRLQVGIEPAAGGCAPRMNRACATAERLSADIPTHSSLIAGRCTDPAEEDSFLYYRLDLTGEPDPIGIHASLLDDSHERMSSGVPLELFVLDGSEPCGTPWASFGATGYQSSVLSSGLPPGDYLLRVRELPAHPAVLDVRFFRPDCSSNTQDTCSTARDLVFEDGFARVAADTYCNTDQFQDETCFGEPPAPDRFYRLDLQGRGERTRVRARLAPGKLEYSAALILLREDEDRCGSVLHCYDPLCCAEGWPRLDMIVEPGAYLIVIEGLVQNAAGNFTLEVELSGASRREFRPCYDAVIDDCARHTNNVGWECCENPLAAACASVFVSCGLHPAVQDCVCERDPTCCDGDEDDFERCGEIMSACNYFCEDDALHSFVCLDEEALRSGG